MMKNAMMEAIRAETVALDTAKWKKATFVQLLAKNASREHAETELFSTMSNVMTETIETGTPAPTTASITTLNFT